MKRYQFSPHINGMRGIFILLLCAAILPAQQSGWITDIEGKNTGQSVFNSLTLPVSAGVLGRGAVSSPGSMNATDIPWYTANLAYFASNRFSINHLEYLLGLRKEYVGASFPLSGIGTVGMYCDFFTTGSWPDARDIDENLSSPKVFDFSIGAAFARLFLRGRLATGISLAYLESHLDDAAARGVSAGIDVKFKALDWFEGRIGAGNIGPDVTYVATPEPLPLRVGASVNIRPFQHLANLTDKFDFDIGVGAAAIADNPLLLGASMESRLFRHLLIRIGYDYAYGKTASLDNLAAGLGIIVNRYAVNFGLKNQSSDLGMAWALSAHYQGEDVQPKTALDFYEAAERRFRKNRLRLSIYYAKKAIALDPNMWRAHTLIARAQAIIRRRNMLEVACIYSGNSRGIFLPEPADASGMGGLARQATAVRQIRNQFPLSFSIDAGNTVTATTHPLKAQLAGRYLNKLGYDAGCIGEGEIDFDYSRFSQEAGIKNPHTICSNCGTGMGKDILPYRIIRRDKYRFAVLNSIAPELVGGAVYKSFLSTTVKGLQQAVEQPEVRNATMRILVAHDTWEGIKELVTQVPGIDLVICGSLKQRFETPMKIGSTLVVSAGEGGRYLGACTFRFDPAGNMIDLHHKLVPLDAGVESDPEIAEEVRLITTSIEFDKHGVDQAKLVRGSIDGTFCFVSDRQGVAGIYLRIIDKFADFPLTASPVICDQPVISFECGKIAYRTFENDHSRIYLMNATGTDKRPLPGSGPQHDARFTPDGVWLYYAAGETGDTATDIMRMRTNGKEAEQVIAWQGSSEREISFSNDGNFMMFSSNREGNRHVYLTDPAGIDPLCITTGTANHSAPAFSPDGKYIAYLTDRTGFKGKKDLCLYNRESGESGPLTHSAHVSEFCWLDDSRKILHSSGINLTDFNLVDVTSGKSTKFIVSDSIKTYSEISPQLITYGGETRILYVREYENGERQIFIVDTDGAADRKLVNSAGDDWLY